MKTECPSSCIAKCPNQAISRGLFVHPDYLEKKYFDDMKGYGIIALLAIKAGSLVIEYTGERRTKMYDGSCTTYVLRYKKGFIDGAKGGNKSQFLNHSCDPNLVVEEWEVDQTLRIVLRATKVINPGTELTFAYGRDTNEVCCFGSKKCSGKLGRRVNRMV
jgi:SET domain-containing protein